ncbi:HAD family phosphatase [Actibacterium sp. 188UL27-1]|uniref:HAD family hydrolase n=1 Tax=Actibacterium sp. 188UL27-1 TaxID=2786961 RepID=UPI00195BBFC3|nr:HAD family phosphatase [Actibacterium sp. 188UL27-1]MBM7067398.1 HAD family phosphatase [Actibacterium sp. 188UL27-1]
MAAVIFDVGNVIIHWQPERQFGGRFADQAALDAALAEHDFAGWYGKRTDPRPWEARLEDCPRGDRFDIFNDYLTSFTAATRDPMEGSADLVTDLIAAGIRVFAITNAPPEADEVVPRQHPIMARFEDVAVSGLEGVKKPDPQIFERVLARNGLVAADCLFTDDSAAYLKGAASVGLRTHLFEGAAGLRSRLRADGFL